ncbi:MarR family transcriptional regulator [Pediococcus pentosaceus]|uniref:MarR family winged helix-turn-helix transcriptional regulator n=1 Tax=Pediococcus pentosaceus TaxID=1255 RepID=UPI003168A22C
MKYYYFSKYFAGIYRLSKTGINHKISDLDVRATQSDLLMFIFEHPNMQQKHIAHEMAVDPSLLVRDLKKLVSMELVLRKPDPSDRRGKLIELSSSGYSIAEKLSEEMSLFWNNIFNNTSNINAEKFEKNLQMLYQALQEDENKQ